MLSRCLISVRINNCRGIASRIIEETLRGHPINLERPAGGGSRAVFQGFGSRPGVRVLLAAVLVRSADVEHGLLRPLLEFAVLITSLQIGYVSGLLSSVSQRQGKPCPRAVLCYANSGDTAPVMPREGPAPQAHNFIAFAVFDEYQ